MFRLQDIAYADDAYKHFPDAFSYETVYNDFMVDMQNISESKVWVCAVVRALVSVLW